MVKTSWGTKRTCPCGNGVRFYDLNKKEIECPSCGESINIEKLSITALENNLRKNPLSQILKAKENVDTSGGKSSKTKDSDVDTSGGKSSKTKDSDVDTSGGKSSKTKDLDVEVDTDDIQKTEVDEIIGKKVNIEEKKD